MGGKQCRKIPRRGEVSPEHLRAGRYDDAVGELRQAELSASGEEIPEVSILSCLGVLSGRLTQDEARAPLYHFLLGVGYRDAGAAESSRQALSRVVAVPPGSDLGIVPADLLKAPQTLIRETPIWVDSSHKGHLILVTC